MPLFNALVEVSTGFSAERTKDDLSRLSMLMLTRAAISDPLTMAARKIVSSNYECWQYVSDRFAPQPTTSHAIAQIKKSLRLNVLPGTPLHRHFNVPKQHQANSSEMVGRIYIMFVEPLASDCSPPGSDCNQWYDVPVSELSIPSNLRQQLKTLVRASLGNVSASAAPTHQIHRNVRIPMPLLSPTTDLVDQAHLFLALDPRIYSKKIVGWSDYQSAVANANWDLFKDVDILFLPEVTSFW